MNETIKQFSKKKIVEGLEKLPDSWQNKFKLMYAKGKTAEEKMSKDIEDVVNNMTDDKLSIALTQVENSLSKINNNRKKITGIEINNILYDIVTTSTSDYPCPYCSLYDLCEETNANDICAKILSENEVFITR